MIISLLPEDWRLMDLVK